MLLKLVSLPSHRTCTYIHDYIERDIDRETWIEISIHSDIAVAVRTATGEGEESRRKKEVFE